MFQGVIAREKLSDMKTTGERECDHIAVEKALLGVSMGRELLTIAGDGLCVEFVVLHCASGQVKHPVQMGLKNQNSWRSKPSQRLQRKLKIEVLDAFAKDYGVDGTSGEIDRINIMR